MSSNAPIFDSPKNDPTTTLDHETMSSENLNWWSAWSDRLGVAIVIFGAIAALVGLIGWYFSWKSGKLKDEEMERFKVTSTQAISASNQVAAAANERTAVLEKETALLKIDNAKLLEKQKQRIVTTEQSIGLRDLLKIAPKGRIDLVTLSTEPEVMSYAEDIRCLLVQSGYESSEDAFSTKIMQGLKLPGCDHAIGAFCATSEPFPDYVEQLRQCLGIVGLNFAKITDSNNIFKTEPGRVILIVFTRIH